MKSARPGKIAIPKRAPPTRREPDEGEFISKLDSFMGITDEFKTIATSLVWELHNANTMDNATYRADALSGFCTAPGKEIALRRATLYQLHASGLISDEELTEAKAVLVGARPQHVDPADPGFAKTYAEIEDRKTLERAYPFLTKARNYFAMLEKLSEQCSGEAEEVDAAFLKDFVVKLQNKQLSIEAIFMVQHLLFWQDREEARRFALSLLLRVPAHEIIPLHNWFMMRPLQII